MSVCVCVGADNRTVSRASVWEALVHTNRRAMKMSACLLTPRTVIGHSREETGNTARSEGLEPPVVSSLLVHDLDGPAWIRHASVDLHDTVNGRGKASLTVAAFSFR